MSSLSYYYHTTVTLPWVGSYPARRLPRSRCPFCGECRSSPAEALQIGRRRGRDRVKLTRPSRASVSRDAAGDAALHLAGLCFGLFYSIRSQVSFQGLQLVSDLLIACFAAYQHPDISLELVLSNFLAALQQLREFFLRLWQTLFRRLAKRGRGTGIILSLKFDQPQQVFAKRILVIGRSLQKTAGLIQIPPRYGSGVNDPSPQPLRQRIILLRRLPVPLERFLRIGRRDAPSFVEISEYDLRRRIPHLSRTTEVLNRVRGTPRPAASPPRVPSSFKKLRRAQTSRRLTRGELSCNSKARQENCKKSTTHK